MRICTLSRLPRFGAREACAEGIRPPFSTGKRGKGVVVRNLTKCRCSLMRAAGSEFGDSPCANVRWCVVGEGRIMVGRRFLCVGRFQAILHPGKFPLGATLRHRRLRAHAHLQVVSDLCALGKFSDGPSGGGALDLDSCRIRLSDWWKRMREWFGLGSRMFRLPGIGRWGLYEGDGICGSRFGSRRHS